MLLLSYYVLYFLIELVRIVNKIGIIDVLYIISVHFNCKGVQSNLFSFQTFYTKKQTTFSSKSSLHKETNY